MSRSSRLSVLALCAALAAQPAMAQSAYYPAGVTGALMERIGFPKPQPPQDIPNAQAGAAAAAADEPVDSAVAQSIGCVLAGTTGTSVALLAGGENVVHIISGGFVLPVNQIALYTALVGVVFGTFCAVGQAVTPLYLYATRGPANGGASNRAVADSSCRLPKLPVAEPRRVQDLIHRAALVTQVDAEPPRDEIDMSAPTEFRRRR